MSLPRNDQLDKLAVIRVSGWRSGLVAFVLSIVFFFCLWPTQQYFWLSQLFLNRGAVPCIITFLMAWSCIILAGRNLRIRRELRDSKLESIGELIDRSHSTAEILHQLIEDLNSKPAEWQSSLAGRRILDGLNASITGMTKSEVYQQLNSQLLADKSRIDAEYFLVRLLTWVIPIFGVIGTVLGIASVFAAASEFGWNEKSSSIYVQGLAVVWDTTLIALPMILVCLIATHVVRKHEHSMHDTIYDDVRNVFASIGVGEKGQHETARKAETSGVASASQDSTLQSTAKWTGPNKNFKRSVTEVFHPGDVVGPCKIARKIGQGGMGIVYLAEHLTLQKQVAVKTISPYRADSVAIERFMREARTCARIEHPNVVPIYDVGDKCQYMLNS